MREFVIILSKESDVSEVRLELNLADTFSIRNNVSGSTTTGVIEAIVNGPRSVTNRAFCEAVKLVPVVDLYCLCVWKKSFHKCFVIFSSNASTLRCKI